jgi:hypothetical protein
MLCLGLLVGLVGNPAVLGRLAPDWYQRHITGAAEQRQAYDDAAQNFAILNKTVPVKIHDLSAQIDALRQTGVSEAALGEKTREIDTRRERLNDAQIRCAQAQAAYDDARAAHAARFDGLLHALVLACLVVMVLETLIDPAATGPYLRWRGNLASVRYACMAAWIALALAQPQLLLSVSFALVLLLLAVGLAVVAIPLRRAAS